MYEVRKMYNIDISNKVLSAKDVKKMDIDRHIKVIDGTMTNYIF